MVPIKVKYDMIIIMEENKLTERIAVAFVSAGLRLIQINNQQLLNWTNNAIRTFE